MAKQRINQITGTVKEAFEPTSKPYSVSSLSGASFISEQGMNTDIRISVTFKDHIKRQKLSLLLGQECAGYLIDLWIGAAIRRPKGVLDGWDELEIALEARWHGDAKKFVDSLLAVGFLEKGENGGYSLHDWRNNQSWAYYSAERSLSAREKAEKRWQKKNGYATSMLPAYSQHANSNAPNPSPNPSPNPNPKPSPNIHTTTNTVISYLQSLNDGIQYNVPYIQDPHYTEVLTMQYPDKPTKDMELLIKVAQIWIVYRHHFPRGMAFKPCENHIATVVTDGYYSVDAAHKQIKAIKDTTKKVGLKIWEVLPAPKQDCSHIKPEIIYKRERN